MSALPHLQEVFELLRRGHHLSPEDEPAFSAVVASYEAYAAYFAPLGIALVRNPREFFYFAPEPGDSVSETLPRVAMFSFILIDDTANAGRPIEEYLFTESFLISRLPHFALDRYTALLRQVDIVDIAGLRSVLKKMERFGWVKFLGEEEFRFLRPFYRVFDKCQELAASIGRSGNEVDAADSVAS